MGKEAGWGVYILQCGDGTLYTGITDDLEHRLAAHRAGRGAKYTRGRGPLTLQFWSPCEDHSAALRREWQIKKLSRPEKIQLIEDWEENLLLRAGKTDIQTADNQFKE